MIPGLTILCLVAGAVLIKLGYWPPRVGSERFCRRCDYPLRTATSGTCPECGEPIATARRRRRVRNRAATGIGVTLVVAGMLLTGGAMLQQQRKVNWYIHAPMWWVLRDLKSPAQQQAFKGWQEIHRRLQAGSLSSRHRRQLGETFARELSAEPPGPLWNLCRGYLEPDRSSGPLDPLFAEPLRAVALPRALRAASRDDLWFAYWLSAAKQLEHLSQPERIALFDRFAALDAATDATEGYDQMAIRHMLIHNVVDNDTQRRALAVAFRRQTDRRRQHNWNDNWWCHWLNQQWQLGKLTDEQEARWLNALHGIRLTVRPRTAEGATIPYLLSQSVRLFGANDCWLRFDQFDLLVDDRVVYSFGAQSMQGNGGLGGRPWRGDAPAGKHELICHMRYILYRGPYDEPAASQNLGTFEQRVVAPFEVCADPADAEPTAIADEGERAMLYEAFQPSKVERVASVRNLVRVQFKTPALPVGVAFDAVAVVDGREYEVMPVTAVAGEDVDMSGLAADVPLVGSVDIILRPSAEAAKRSVDVTSYWTGDDLVYRDVPVTVDDQR